MRKGLKGPLVVSGWQPWICQKACAVGCKPGQLLWCEREDNPSTHKYKNRVKEESSYTQLLSSYWISWLFSAMLYHTCYCCTCRSDICYPACSAPSARLQLAAPGLASCNQLPEPALRHAACARRIFSPITTFNYIKLHLMASGRDEAETIYNEPGFNHEPGYVRQRSFSRGFAVFIGSIVGERFLASCSPWTYCASTPTATSTHYV